MKTNFYLKKPILLLLLLVGFVFTMNAQGQTKVSGTVVGADNMPLPGASVLEKGTSNNTQTNFDGGFSFDVSNLNATLVVTYVGFKEKEIPLIGSSTIKIILNSNLTKLDEIIVVAYGTQKKANISGAVSTIGSSAISGRPTADFQNAIQGQVAGLNITKSNGAPGGRTSAVIRGQGSITGGNNPLYVIDGIIMNNFIGNQGAGFTSPDPLAAISPSDIETITVLKDASAASIYGARSANGVILITTKRGKAGKARFEFNTYSGFQTAWNKLDLLNSQEYQQVWNNARDNAVQKRIPALDGTTLTTNTNWQDEVLQSAPISNFDFRASGGGESTTYSTSLNYFNQEGIVIGTGLKRYNITANSDTKLGRFKFGSSLNVSRTIYDKESVNNETTILNSAIISAPNVPVYDANNLGGYAGPTLADGEPTMNPVAAQNLIDNTNTVNRILANVYGEYEIVKNLKFKMSVGLDYIDFHDRLTVPDFNLNQNQIPGFEQGAMVREYRGENNSALLENTLNYKFNVDKSGFDILAGYSAQETHFADMSVTVLGQFSGTGLPVLSGSKNVSATSGIISESKTTSIFGRIMYNYDDRYLATANFRRDGSSKFVGDNQFANFYSGSVAWRISKEAFMQNSEISDLKLRASYGSLGNDAINSNSARFTLNQNATYVLGTSQGVAPGVGPSGSMQNSDLRWEKQTQLDYGLDLGLLENRFSLTVDYFNKKSEDLLLTIPVPGHTGFSSITLNAGEIVNKGWEFTANYRDKIGENFTWGVGGNLSLLDNNVTKLADGIEYIETSQFGQLSSVYRVRIAEGNPVRSFYGYQTDGIFQTAAEVAAAPFQNAVTSPGDFRYKDLNGDNVIDAEDQTFIGNANPDFTYGLNLNMGYKNWDFSVQFYGVSGNDIWSETKFYTQSYARTNNLNRVVLDAWTPTNPSTTVPRQYPQTLSDNDRVSDFFIEDGSYFRMKNLQIGYSLPSDVLNKLKLSKARFYLAGQNVFTITGYSKIGYDPEIDSNGIDNVTYPQAQTFTLGLQFGF